MLATRLLRYINIRNEMEVAELNRRASQFVQLGQYSEAKKSILEALEKTKEDYGTYHPAYLAAKCNLALIHKYLGDYNQSVELYKEAYQGYVKSLGEEHKSTLIALQNLGNA